MTYTTLVLVAVLGALALALFKLGGPPALVAALVGGALHAANPRRRRRARARRKARP